MSRHEHRTVGSALAAATQATGTQLPILRRIASRIVGGAATPGELAGNRNSEYEAVGYESAVVADVDLPHIRYLQAMAAQAARAALGSDAEPVVPVGPRTARP